MTPIKQSTATTALVFFMADSTDHVTGKTGLSPTVTLSKNGATFAAPAGAVTEIGNGFYRVAANATDSNTLGILALYATATGADPAAMAFVVVAFDPQLASMGLSLAKTTNITGLNDIAAADVWSVGTRSLTTFGSLVADVTTAVWAAATRTLSAFAFTPTPSNAADVTAIKAKTDLIPATPAAVGSAMTLTSGERTSIGTAVWATTTRSLTTFGSLVADVTTAVWAAATRTLSAFAFTPTPSNAGDTTAIKAKTDNLPASPAATGDIPSAASNAAAVWAAGTRTLTSSGSGGATAQEVWEYAMRTLTATSDSSGVTTLLTRNNPLDAAATQTAAAAALTAYDPPTRTEATADKAEVLTSLNDAKGASFDAATDSLEALRNRGDAAWTTGGGGGGSSLTAAEIADAVWDESLAGHATAGTTGAAISAASASGDPWATVVPGAYDDGTAGAAIGRLNNTPPDAPVIIIPSPAADASLCTVYVYTENLANEVIEGLEISFRPVASGLSERVVVKDTVTITTDEDGFGSATLQRGIPVYIYCPRLGLKDYKFTFDTDTYNLADLFS